MSSILSRSRVLLFFSHKETDMTFLRGILDRIILVISIVAAGCIPSFIAQYRQRVGGRLDQINLDLAPFQAIANQLHHGSLQELIRYHLASADATFHKEGAAIQLMVESASRLQDSYTALGGSLLNQMVYLSVHSDLKIAQDTWQIFAPSFGLSWDHVMFALSVGMTIWLLFLAGWWLTRRVVTRYFKGK
jgi:Protein of unknown function (DUF2937)